MELGVRLSAVLLALVALPAAAQQPTTTSSTPRDATGLRIKRSPYTPDGRISKVQ